MQAHPRPRCCPVTARARRSVMRNVTRHGTRGETDGAAPTQPPAGTADAYKMFSVLRGSRPCVRASTIPTAPNPPATCDRPHRPPMNFKRRFNRTHIRQFPWHMKFPYLWWNICTDIRSKSNSPSSFFLSTKRTTAHNGHPRHKQQPPW